MMSHKAVFEGLVFDENDTLLDVSYVGGEACYIVDDEGFKLHVPSEHVDRQVLDMMREQIMANKDLIAEQTAEMIGQDDIFTHAIITNQLENVDDQLTHLLKHGIPESGRIYLGMLGFKIVINHHGDVIRIEQPSVPIDDE